MYPTLKKKIRNYFGIFTLLVYLFFPQVSFASNSVMNFLPMEDALSTSRNEIILENIDVKPYRETVSFEKHPTEKISLGSIDAFSFIILILVFLIISRRNSKSRKINL